jgi:hypothetical protein
MNIQSINMSDFSLVELADDGKINKVTPHCRIHRAMNKVSMHKDYGGYWRCLQAQCRAGCIEIRKDNPEG